MDVGNCGYESLVQLEKESALSTIILEDSFLLPLQPQERCGKGACVNRGSLLHCTLICTGAKWSADRTGNWMKICQDP